VDYIIEVTVAVVVTDAVRVFSVYYSMMSLILAVGRKEARLHKSDYMS